MRRIEDTAIRCSGVVAGVIDGQAAPNPFAAAQAAAEAAAQRYRGNSSRIMCSIEGFPARLC